MSKHGFFLENRSAAREAFERPALLAVAHELEDQDPLLRELRLIFDWMARETGAKRISSRLFKQRLPDIHRKFPQLANNFARMDANSDCWLDWDEFACFCLKDERLAKSLRRAASVSVFGLSRTGERSFKDPFDPTHMCELGASPAILPWETSHIVEWRIEGLRIGQPGQPLVHAGTLVRPGASVASPPFRAAGVCGFLRFWPAGYWTESQRTRRTSEIPGAEAARSEGRCRPPSASSWCCVGACLPRGSHLALRFFVGDEASERRECYWGEGTHVHQLWGPKSAAPPNELRRRGPEDATLVVGIEILRNLTLQKGLKEDPGPRSALGEQWVNQRPVLKDPLSSGAPIRGSILMNSSKSLPALLPKSLGSHQDLRKTVQVLLCS